MILETLCVGPFQVNCYILAPHDNSQTVIIDPGYDTDKIKKVLNKYNLKPAFIINTHGHYDHIGCDNDFDVPVYIHRQDSILLKDPMLNLSNFLMSAFTVQSEIRKLEDKENITLDQIRMEIIHTPGHTPGGICLLMHQPTNKILFSGDTLFCQGIGRTDFPGSNEQLLIKSIKEKLFKLADDTIIYPGHGPSSTIGEEKKSNPFLI